MVLVRVREHDGADLAVAQVAEVRQDQVDAEVLVAREREAGVDDDQLVADLEDGHVLPDLAEAAERDHPQHWSFICSEAYGRSVAPGGLWKRLSTGCGRRGYAATSSPRRARQSRTRGELVVGRRDEREAVAADLVPEQVERRLDRDRVRRDPAAGRTPARARASSSRGALEVAFDRGAHLLGDLRADDVRVDADAAGAAELEERLEQDVVAGVEVEAESRRCAAPRRAAACACLTARDVVDLREPRDRLGLDVDDDAARDVVDDDRPVGRARDRLEVRDDPALRRLVVVRRDDEEAVGAELVRLPRSGAPSARRVRAGAGDDGGAVADRLDPRRGSGRAARRRRASGSRRSCPRPRGRRSRCRRGEREALEGVEVDRAVLAQRRRDRGQDAAEHRRSIVRALSR